MEGAFISAQNNFSETTFLMPRINALPLAPFGLELMAERRGGRG